AKFDRTEPEVVAAIDKVVDAAARHGVVAGIHNATAAYARRMIDQGFRFVTVLSDVRILAAAARDIVDSLRGDPA
ncbi:MAG: 2,4-dihydroxyhept-2-ene-1,7-dioic acid aldolase, partial [Proteobacteria bacterium]|nr:2,4-dihydroxyhept-2-ene-1,7-dioic acid aldolase [Pseudomonadota bacterium]